MKISQNPIGCNTVRQPTASSRDVIAINALMNSLVLACKWSIVPLSLYRLRNSWTDCFDTIILSSNTKYSTIDEILYPFQCKERI